MPTTATAPRTTDTAPAMTRNESQDDDTRTPCGDLLPDHLVDGHVNECPGCLTEIDRWDAALA